MAGYIGKIGEYDPSTENWAMYVERLQHFFSANKVDDAALKKDAFLTCVGKETFGLLRALVVPAKLADKTYDELVAALTAHFAPKPLIIAERFRFHKRDQKKGEKVRDYAASLQKLAEHCSFRATITETLRDRLVCGMRNENVQKRLLTKADLTFTKALKAAEIAEQAARYAEQLQSGLQADNPADVASGSQTMAD